MKYGKQQAIKRKIDKQDEENLIAEDIKVLSALIAKTEALDDCTTLAYTYARELGYDLRWQMDMQMNPDPLAPKSGRISVCMIYRNQKVTATGLKPIPKYINIGKGYRLKTDLSKRQILDLIDAHHGDDDTMVKVFVESGEEMVHRTLNYEQYKQAIRGFNANGHAVQRLVGRSDDALTYGEAREILRTHDMSEPIVHGMEVKFNPDGSLATIF